jgi:peptidoglycan hydrolase-like protein with peptidoglycan-binding domain
MADDPTPWLTTMGKLDGTKWAPSDGKPNPTIQGWLRDIAAAYPDTSAYCNSVINEDYFSWCGLTVGYCVAMAKIPPVFGPSEVTRFLYAAAWLGWGTPVTTSPQPGDVLVFDFGGGDHHVTLFEKDNGDGTYSCHGGNQSHEVNVTKFPKRCLMGVRRPSTALPLVIAGTLAPGAEGRPVAALQSALASLGFDPGGIDGEFGPLTSAAVSNFQRARNLPITGIADPATLQKLGVAADSSPQPTVATSEPTMQWQDILKPLIDALIAKQGGAATTTTQAQGQVDVSQLLQTAIAALAGRPLPIQSASAPAGTAGTTSPPVLSVIDQIFGGQALAGKKTMLAVIAYVVLAILQATGVVGTATGASATPAGEILTTLIAAFGALDGAAKFDRLSQVLGQVATQSAPPQK